MSWPSLVLPWVSSMSTRSARTASDPQPAQLDEQPVGVGVLLLKAQELFLRTWRASSRTSTSTQECLHPALAGTSCHSAAPDRDRAEAQDVSHSLGRVMSTGDNKVFLPRGAARSVSTIRSVSVDPVEHPAAQPLAQAPPQPSPFHLPLLQLVETSRAGWRGFCGVSPCCRWARLQRVRRLERPGAARSAVVGDLLVCERSGDGVSWLPSRAAANGPCGNSWWWWMLLQCTFPVLLPTGAPADRRLTGGQLRPTGRWRKLGPHIIERGMPRRMPDKLTWKIH